MKMYKEKPHKLEIDGPVAHKREEGLSDYPQNIDTFRTGGLEYQAGERAWSQGGIFPQELDQFVTGGERRESELFFRSPSRERWFVGEIIASRYRLEVPIGAGGMGQVWKAQDLEDSSTVALKRLWPHLLSNGYNFQHFLQEMKCLRNIRHPQIVRVFECYPEHAFFVMEWLDGEDLRSALREKGRMSLSEVCQISIQIASALECAHEQGLIHRDLKPENVFVCKGDSLKIKLLDFGISFFDERTQCTTRWGGMGSAYYMAPEQLYAQKEISYPCDVYSFGVLLYELLVGRIPTLGAPPLSSHFPALFQAKSIPSSECPPGLEDDYLQILRSFEKIQQRTILQNPASRCSLKEIVTTLKWCDQDLKKKREALESECQGNLHKMLLQGKLEAPLDCIDTYIKHFPGNPVFELLKQELLRERTQLKRLEGEVRALLDAEAGTKAYLCWEKAAFSSKYSAIYWEHPLVEAILFAFEQERLEYLDLSVDFAVSDCMEHHHSWVRGLAFDGTGEHLASASMQIGCWRTSSFSFVGSFRGHRSWVRALAFHPSLPWLASASEDDLVILWDLESGEQRMRLSTEGKSGGLWDLAFSSDGQYLAAATGQGHIILWSLPDGVVNAHLHKHIQKATSVCFSPRGNLLASASEDGKILLWSTKDGSCVRTFRGPKEVVGSVLFAPDGRQLIGGYADGKISVWEPYSGLLLSSFSAHEQRIRALAMHPKGHFLLSGSDDTTIAIWDGLSGHCVQRLQGHESRVLRLAMHPSGSYFASSSADTTVRLWKNQAQPLTFHPFQEVERAMNATKCFQETCAEEAR